MLDVVPGASDAEDGPPPRDDIERRDDLREDGRVAVGHAGDERAERQAGYVLEQVGRVALSS